MNNILEQNLQALKECRPVLWQKINNIAENPGIKVFASASGSPSLKVNKIHLHSAYDPWKETEYLVEELDLEKTEALVIVGFGLGYHVKKIYKDPFFKGKLLIIEKDLAIFKKALETIDFVNLLRDQSVILFAGEDIPDLGLALDQLRFFRINQIWARVLIHPASNNLFPQYYLEILKILRGLLSFSRGSFTALQFFQDIWQENSVNNLFLVTDSPGLAQVRNIVEGGPAIIVSAGPSLDKDIEELKKIKGKIPIFCVGTAYKALLKGGIEPDYVVAIDADPILTDQFKDIDKPEQTVLFAADFIIPEVIEMYKPKTIIFDSCKNPFAVFLPDSQKEKGIVYAGGSVAHAATDIAVQLGFDEIILVGQDLCHEGARTHAANSVFENDRVEAENEAEFDKKDLVWLKGNYQEKVVSTRLFYVFVTGFERYIKIKPEIKFINATSGGAFIQGTEVKRLKQAVEKYRNKLSTGELKAKIFQACENFEPDYPGFRHSLETAVKGLKEAVSDLEQGYQRSLKLKDIVSDRENKENLQEYARSLSQVGKDLENIGRRLNENEFIKVLLFGKGYYEFILLEMDLKMMKTEVEAQKKLCASAPDIYKGFLDSAGFIINKCENFLKRKELCQEAKNTN